MGIDYEQLPESYVIFICDFDPIGLGKYKYTRRQVIEEDLEYNYDDGSYTVFLSTVGLIQERRSVLVAECESALLTFSSAHSCNPPEAFISVGDFSPTKIKTLHAFMIIIDTL